jgi:hypothetical protein
VNTSTTLVAVSHVSRWWHAAATELNPRNAAIVAVVLMVSPHCWNLDPAGPRTKANLRLTDSHFDYHRIE